MAGELARLFADPLELAAKLQLDLQPANLERVVARCAEISATLMTKGLREHTDLVAGVRVHEAGLDTTIGAAPVVQLLEVPRLARAPQHISLSSSVRLTRTGRAVRLVHTNGAHATADPPDTSLIALTLRAREWWAILRQGAIGPVDLARDKGVSLSYITRVVRLAFLAPKVVDAILEGRLRAGVDSKMLLRKGAIPTGWQEQEALLVAG